MSAICNGTDSKRIADIVYHVLSGEKGAHELFTLEQVLSMIESEEFSTKLKVNEVSNLIRSFHRDHKDLLGGLYMNT